jgi:hypothetical protein
MVRQGEDLRSGRSTCGADLATSRDSSMFDSDDTLMLSALVVIAGQGKYPLPNFSSVRNKLEHAYISPAR